MRTTTIVLVAAPRLRVVSRKPWSYSFAQNVINLQLMRVASASHEVLRPSLACLVGCVICAVELLSVLHVMKRCDGEDSSEVLC